MKKEVNIIKEKYGLEKDNYILFLARVVPEKGCHYLIEAYNKLSEEERKNKKLVIAGGSSHSDEYYSQIIEMCKDNKNIILTGFVQGDELWELFSNTCLYVLPSDIEGMPISLLEAMSYERTCLVSNIEENVEVMNENCYSFEKSNVEDLKNKLVECLNLENKKETTIQVPNWDEVVKQTLCLYSGGECNEGFISK